MKLPLTANREQIAEFYRLLFQRAPANSWLPLIAFYDKGEPAEGPVYWPWRWFNAHPGNLDKVIDHAVRCAQMCANHPRRVVFCPPIATFRTTASAKRENLAAGLAISVECDNDGREAALLLYELLGQPTVEVASGGLCADGSPKRHWHWRLAKPAMTPGAQQQLVTARQLACALADSDHTSINPVHPIRWPGSFHRKSEPRMARIVESKDREVDLEAAFTRLAEEAVARGLGHYENSSRKSGNSDLMARDQADVARWLRGIPNLPPEVNNSWHFWNRVGMATWAATGGAAWGCELWVEWSSRHPAFNKPQHADYARRRWRHYGKSPPGKLGAGTLAWLHAEHWSDDLDVAGDDEVEP